jgi:hypothetical protein
MKAVLGLFQAPKVSVYIDKLKCSIISQAELEALDTKERKAFKAVAMISLARIL